MVIALREALNLTQQEFATVLQAAISTVARWETKDPPKGDALLQLSNVAWKRNQPVLCDHFETLFLDEVLPRLHCKRIRKSGDKSGWIVCRYDSRNDAKPASEFLLHSAADLADIANQEKP